jgi:hypothetical protein
MSLLSRLEQLEAALAPSSPRPPVHAVIYSVADGCDGEAERMKAQAEFDRVNPDWSGHRYGPGDPHPICLIELRGVSAAGGGQRHGADGA